MLYPQDFKSTEQLRVEKDIDISIQMIEYK